MAPAVQPPRLILVVEDNEVTREGLVAVLQREGFAVAPVANAQEALDYLRDRPAPDLIVLDMLMPVLDGWGFLKALGQLSPRPAVPILVLTSTILTREWADDHGCAGFVRKPIATEELLAEVRRCLEGDARQPPSPRGEP
jgi:CheY-like chemotaxis protein